MIEQNERMIQTQQVMILRMQGELCELRDRITERRTHIQNDPETKGANAYRHHRHLG